MLIVIYHNSPSQVVGRTMNLVQQCDLQSLKYVMTHPRMLWGEQNSMMRRNTTVLISLGQAMTWDLGLSFFPLLSRMTRWWLTWPLGTLGYICVTPLQVAMQSKQLLSYTARGVMSVTNASSECNSRPVMPKRQPNNRQKYCCRLRDSFCALCFWLSCTAREYSRILHQHF